VDIPQRGVDNTVCSLAQTTRATPRSSATGLAGITEIINDAPSDAKYLHQAALSRTKTVVATIFRAHRYWCVTNAAPVWLR
jgi:hypothetical protein